MTCQDDLIRKLTYPEREGDDNPFPVFFILHASYQKLPMHLLFTMHKLLCSLDSSVSSCHMSTCQKTSLSIRKNKTLFFARLMNLKSCLMSVRGKQRNVQDYVARRHGSRSEVGSPPWQGGYRNKSYPLLHQQGIHSLDFFS